VPKSVDGRPRKVFFTEKGKTNTIKIITNYKIARNAVKICGQLAL